MKKLYFRFCAAVAACVLVPPAMAQSCLGDLNADRAVTGADLGILLGQWGQAGTGDLDGNGIVGGGDIGLMLGAWGVCPVTVPSWATLVEAQPDPAVVTDPALRAAIVATGLASRVRDTVTQVELVLIPPGTFLMGCIMGSSQSECYIWPGEAPVHQVTLTNAFYLGRYEVTQAQWVAKMGSNPSAFQGPPYGDAASRPVEQVSWTAVQSYLSGTGMRLPTEAEWEYACRAGTQTPFYNGSSNEATVGVLAWTAFNAVSQTHAVGGKLPNGFGLYDMLGNVWEWVNDWYSPYLSNSQTNPTGPGSGVYRMNRGGSWRNSPDGGRSSSRLSGAPVARGDDLGFRVARNP